MGILVQQERQVLVGVHGQMGECYWSYVQERVRKVVPYAGNLPKLSCTTIPAPWISRRSDQCPKTYHMPEIGPSCAYPKTR